ncbi:uncharacterized protein LOC110844026 [Folsomia candida]|uniref:uncharacterized protein LOC110844026 n=1 Tax=Folsomia candida TaxID=158441 RepID=UPI001604E584|nr:uncharacterized protein LOC110844026 [Folsomia candida]
MMKSIKELGIILFIIGSVVGKLRLSRVMVPPFKMKNENATLECPFELGTDRLYAIKWYKDNEEFFRYVPRYRPPIHTHHLAGVSVSMEGSDQKFVTLRHLDLRSTGTYRCEVSAEGPSFASVSGEGKMTVIHLPEHGPQITGKIQEEYENGDNLVLNCSSAKSFPPARLSWFINDQMVEKGVEQLKPKRANVPLTQLGMQSTMSTLNVSLEPSHFSEDGEAKVRCLATISTLFWQDGDERIVGSSRKLPDLRSINLSPVFQDDREASLLVRGGVSKLTICPLLQLLTIICICTTYLLS